MILTCVWTWEASSLLGQASGGLWQVRWCDISKVLSIQQQSLLSSYPNHSRFHSRLSHLIHWGIYYVDDEAGCSQSGFLGLFCNMDTACEDFLLFSVWEWFNQSVAHTEPCNCMQSYTHCCWFTKFATVHVRISCVWLIMNEAEWQSTLQLFFFSPPKE